MAYKKIIKNREQAALKLLDLLENFFMSVPTEDCTSGNKHSRITKVHRDAAKEKLRVKRANNKKLGVELLGSKCRDCSGVFPDSVYHFHHPIPEEKEYQVSKYLSRYDFNTLKLEILKCILLCPNCHSKRHIN